MPLLKHKNQPDPVVDHSPDESPNRKGSLFSRRRRSTSDDMQPSSRSAETDTNGHHDVNGRSNTRGGFFSRRRSHSSDDSMRSSGNRSGIKSRQFNDPSIIAARQKVSGAEEAERQADRALIEARATVREARQHVKNLEREIEEEARLHRLKQKEAKQVSKSAKGLGRYS
ncbi:hypothetical protein ACEPAI_8171 [Sanghuangporus weigelae]